MADVKKRLPNNEEGEFLRFSIFLELKLVFC